MKKSENYILLRQIGRFINVFDEGAIIISYLMNYRLLNGKVGFPVNALPKVLNVLETKCINYETRGTTEDVVINFKNKNKYNTVLQRAIRIKELNNRYINIEDDIKNLSIEQLDKIISFIEEVINE